MAPFESFGTVSYSHSIVGLTMTISCIISEIKREIGRDSEKRLYGVYAFFALLLSICSSIVRSSAAKVRTQTRFSKKKLSNRAMVSIDDQ